MTPETLSPLELAILDVLSGARRLVMRGELSRVDSIRRIRRDPNAIREAINGLVSAGLVAEPRGKGKGVELADAGRRRLGRAA